MSNLKNELIITTTWLCNKRGECGRENTTTVNTADFPNYVPARVMVSCSHCGELHVIWICPGWEAEMVGPVTYCTAKDGSEILVASDA